MTGKTVIVTGGTRGIGKEIARGLTALGADVVLLGRDRARGEAAATELRGEGSGAVSFLPVDLSSLSDVRRVADELSSRWDRIDALVNNAAVVRAEREATVDGHEETLAVGHLAPFLLTELLLPTLERSAPSRVVNVSSGGVRRGQVDLDDIQSERGYAPLDAYVRAKVLNLAWTFELARRVEGTGVSVFAVDPGIADTGTHRDYPRPLAVRAIMRVVWLLLGRRFSPARAARSAIVAASAPELEGRTGLLLDRHGEPTGPPEVADRPEVQRQAVEVTRALVGLPADLTAAAAEPGPAAEGIRALVRH